jgi:hypothetical protein
MMKAFIGIVVSALFQCPVIFASVDVVLSERILKLSQTAAELSSLAYEEDPPGEAFGHFGFYDSEPDQALVAQKGGYCFAAFRGTTLTWDDWKQYVIVSIFSCEVS